MNFMITGYMLKFAQTKTVISVRGLSFMCKIVFIGRLHFIALCYFVWLKTYFHSFYAYCLNIKIGNEFVPIKIISVILPSHI